ncbi:MAG TPA: hypothetical protein VFG72_09845 [Marmoricola sp.]|nr:hypothetical protein [Marmoricola sp.]
MRKTQHWRKASLRAAGISTAAVLGVTGLAACDSAGPETGEVTTEDLQDLEEDLGSLEERVGVLEAGDTAAGGAVDEPIDDDLFWDDPGALLGQEVTVSADVTEVVISGDNGIAFLMGDDIGDDPIAVISASPPSGLEVDNVVKVTGTVVQIQRDTFEEDFGVAEDDLFDDPDAFFADEEGQVAISATQMEVLEQEAEG